MHLTPILGIFLVGQALLATGAAIVGPANECRMVLVVHEGDISDFDCQGGTTVCDTVEDYSCTRREWEDPAGKIWHHCRCCTVEEVCWGGSEIEGFCLVQIVVPPSGPAEMVCTSIGQCQGTTFCPENPTPVTGVATCPCQ